MVKESERHVQSMADGLRLLEAFRSDETLRLEDLHRRTGIPRSRILRYAGTLQAAGYLERYDNGAFRLGLKLFAMGSLLQGRVTGLVEIIRPSLVRLSTISGNTVFYSVLQGFDRIVLAKEAGGEGLRFVVSEGSRRPLHSGATGKLLLAFADPDLQEQIRMDPSLSHPGEGPRADIGNLDQELQQIRRQGFAISRGEATPHGFAVAVPLPVRRGGVLQHDAITIAGPLGMLSDDLADRYVKLLKVEAGALLATAPSGALVAD